MHIKLTSINGTIIYEDNNDHFENGVLRLLSLDKDSFKKWIELSELSNGKNLIESLAKGFANLKKYNKSINIWYDFIAENECFGINKNICGDIAFLMKKDGDKYIREFNPPIYEKEYFEGNKFISGGYEKYLKQSVWRLEKATRQVNEISHITKLNKANVLDIGSGYGYFRKALDNAGYIHEGIEVSSFAINMTKKLYNFDTYLGTISDYNKKHQNKFDIITMWDIIEHICDYEKFLLDVYFALKQDGFAIIKTPNIICPEIEIFGPYYHLVYISNDGLLNIAKKIGFKPYLSTSVSHLLSGFFSSSKINEWEKSLQGADLIIYLKK